MVIKKNKPIPDENHIARYVPWSKLRKDKDDNVLGVLGEAFKLKPNEKYLSATLLEHFTGNYEQQTAIAIQEVRKYFHVKPKSHFTIGKVGDIKSVCSKKRSVVIHIVSYPTDTKLINSRTLYKNESHVSVKKLPQDDNQLLELIASDVWNDLIPNSSIPF